MLLSVLAHADGCHTDLDCRLNGKCDASTAQCSCFKPWVGSTCDTMQYKITPSASKNIYNTSDPRNTWNGPIVTDPTGLFHIYVPLYKVGSLGGPTTVLHGIAKNVTGPWDWDSRPQISTHGGENPAAVVYKDDAGKLQYTLWIGGKVLQAESADGPFNEIEGFSYPGGNPAPIYKDGAFYMTNQGTTQIFTIPKLEGTWSVFSNINHTQIPEPAEYYHTEDPFMWIDQNGNWHIINHAYRNDEYLHCGNSTVSAHWYSTDGKDWKWSPQPYTHTVEYDDGSSHTYTTLERPNIHFDANGQMTHLNVAADLVTGDEGCANRTEHSHFGHCPCDNCKWADHAGTIVIALDV